MRGAGATASLSSTRTAKDEGTQGAIGAALRHELELPAEIDGEKLPLKYETHGEASVDLVHGVIG